MTNVFENTRKSAMFAVFNAKGQHNSERKVFFMPTSQQNAVNILGHHTLLTDYLASHRSCSLARTEGGGSFCIYTPINFIRKMPKNNEVRPSVNNSNAVSTPNGAKSDLQQEVEAKNMAYAFILSKNLFSEFIEFAKANSNSCVLNLDIPQLLTIQNN